LKHEKQKRKRSKKMIEHVRAEEGSRSIMLSPGTKRRSKGERKKQQRAREKAFAKVRKGL
jgi:hypothetical protein